MSIMTIRLAEAKHARLRQLAASQGVSLNKLVDEWASIVLAQHDAEARFRAIAASGSPKRGLELLDRLDRAFAKGGQKRSRNSHPAKRSPAPLSRP